MILLSGNSLTPARKVPVEAMSLQLKERDSSATMTPSDMTGIQVNSWLKDEGYPGNGIVWRVKSITKAFAMNTPTVNLEHAVATLKDRILFGTHGPAQITGNSKATTCTALQAVRYILGQQSDWTLGTFSFNVSNPYKFDGDTLLDALETISDSLEDAWWSYDFSTYPFRLNITQKSSAVGSELRASRNLRTVTMTVDKSGMYTRFYPIGANDLHLDGNGYVEKNTDAYGIVSRVETDNSIDSKSELQRWANERLKAHAEPTVSIDVEGFELADATGESMDRLTLGTVCRIPLPEYGTTILERIVSLSYPDKIHNPDVVKITLSNNRTDITKIIADSIKKGGRSSRASAKKDKEDNAWFEDTNEHVAMCARGIIGVDENGNPKWERLSTLQVDGDGIYGSVKSVMGDMVIAQTKISQNENAITLEAQRAKGKEGELSSKITVEANKISQVVEAVGKDGQVTAASIVLAINESSGESEAKIDAQRVYIGNQKSTTVINGKCSLSDVTADYIAGRIATLSTLRGISASFSGNISASGAVMAEALYIGSSVPYKNVSDAIKQLQIVDNGNNTYTLQKKNFSDSSWVDVATFEHAASTGTTLSGSWSGRYYTVTASPQGNIKVGVVYDGIVPVEGTVTRDGTNIKKDFIVYSADENGDADVQIMRKTLTIDATLVYNAGAASVTLSGSWSGRNFTVTGSGGQIKVGTVYDGIVPVAGTVTRSSKTVKQDFIVYSADANGDADVQIMRKNLSIDATEVYNAGHNEVAGSDIILSSTYGGGVGSETTSVPSSNITKANGYFSGYVWLKEAGNSYYKNLRAFSFSMPSDATWYRSQYGTSGQYIYSCTVAGKTYTKIY